MSVKRKDLIHFLNELLNPNEFKDYSLNGLQIEGTNLISKIAFAVSATQASIKKAIDLKADTLLAHHGIFWKHQGARVITGPFANRVIPLIKNGMNLIAYHLPLDAQPEMGNAATIAKTLDMVEFEPFGEVDGVPVGIKARFQNKISAKELQEKIEKTINHKVILSSPHEEYQISTMGIITGGASSDWKQAVSKGLDAYLTGETTEYDWHDSQEAGIYTFACGHHATEKPGALSLMKAVQDKFDVECTFIDSDNPV